MSTTPTTYRLPTGTVESKSIGSGPPCRSAKDSAGTWDVTGGSNPHHPHYFFTDGEGNASLLAGVLVLSAHPVRRPPRLGTLQPGDRIVDEEAGTTYEYYLGTTWAEGGRGAPCLRNVTGEEA